MHYNYCPECGTKLIDKIAGDDGPVPYCENCSKFWFDSFGSCIIVLVANEEKEIALLSQKYMSDTYKNFVSGYISPGENAEETAVREVKEELGVELEKLKYAGTYWFQAKGLLMHGFLGYAKKCEFQLSKEVDRAEWIPAKEAVKYFFPDVPGNAMHPMYRIYMEENF